jgi:DNA-directed RNA polymerase subunit RPC12/RpoP
MNVSAALPAVTADVRKFPCAACGADVVWNPGADALRCPYCGTERAVPKKFGQVVEKPIEEGLRAPRDLGWGVSRKTVRCQRCGASQSVEPGLAALRCAFCGAPAVVEAPAAGNMIRPEGLLPFKVDRHRAAEMFRGWLSRLWFRPNDLGEKSELNALQGVYVPFWTFDAATHSDWEAEAGTPYQVTVDGRSETRIRWEPSSGFLEKFFDDLPVAASKGVPRPLLQGLEPFPTKDLLVYDPSFLSGFLAEEYAVDLAEALREARLRMEAEIRSACAAQIPAPMHRNLVVKTAWSGLAYKSGLFPIWIAAYDYRGAPYRFLVNGVTGKVSGKAPWSAMKIVLALLAAFVLLVLISTLSK